jgi:hypothetical protein
MVPPPHSQGHVWFGTRFSKGRLNFLDLLRAGHTDYVLDDAAYDEMRNQGLSAATVARLRAHPQMRFNTNRRER